MSLFPKKLCIATFILYPKYSRDDFRYWTVCKHSTALYQQLEYMRIRLSVWVMELRVLWTLWENYVLVLKFLSRGELACLGSGGPCLFFHIRALRAKDSICETQRGI